MNIREALINASPSLEMHRAAAQEIARLDAAAATREQHVLKVQRDRYELERALIAAVAALRDCAGDPHEPLTRQRAQAALNDLSGMPAAAALARTN